MAALPICLSPVQMAGPPTCRRSAGSALAAVRADGSVAVAGVGLGTVPVIMPGEGGLGTLNLDLFPMLFTPQFNKALGSVVQSNMIVITGIANGSSISVTGGDYKVDAGAFSSVAGTVNNGQAVTLRQTASANCGTTLATTVTIAGVPRDFNVSTIACDTTPNAIADFTGRSQRACRQRARPTRSP
jgi:hypothetical protein